MNTERYGCFACDELPDFSPVRFAGPLDELMMAWNGLDDMGKGVAIAGALLLRRKKKR